ncbi:zinc-binding dehydrogenase [Actinoplanes teichomyceticus]|uniref:NADPH:quinone reductase-like Zn-dependent oxidoreductase n=1 Tax=Actinoplanes teichomyceticus TaxID=1867 RepID=A0A561VIJ6_ACTTI|nr:zinc-binding dehydrogenase [Actinoplanes teichomyceticus]TWG11441.1 NADPH:quinone reductase-like Zn-dependent oxidoreductase [Actinoplanes teichomyceticus]GIF15745.1 oxidoreductase [Actinoplanes teichomyceticus]
MQAVIADREARGGFRRADIPEPVPQAGQVLIEVRHVSLNRGEARHPGAFPAGAVLGYDAAGVVIRAAEDGTGPAVGERVVAFGPGAWAERAVFATADVVVVPESLDLGIAAALPMAGITALRTLRAVGSVLGREVLITGASGGVGRFAVQLARLGGAYVVASVGSVQRGAGLTELGADEVVVGLDGITGPFDVILEHVGGAHLVRAWSLLRPGGVLQSIGWASGEPAVFPPNSIFAHGAAKTLRSFGDAADPGRDLATLVDLAARGAVSVQVGWRDSWKRMEGAIQALLGQQVAGKAVMDID